MTIQPQYIAWPIILVASLLIALAFLAGSLIPYLRKSAAYKKDNARYLAEDEAWQTAYDKAYHKHYEEMDSLPKPMREHWSRYEYEQANPRPERTVERPWDWTDTWQFIAALIAAFVTLIATVVVLVIFAPYDGKFYTYEHVHGTVTETTNFSQTTDGKYVYTNYLFKVDSVKGLLLSDDDRVLSYKAGDTVDLTCHWSFVPFGAPTHDCFPANPSK